MRKVALVTGSSSSLGDLIARELSASTGYIVYGSSRSKGHGRGYKYLKLDITSDKECAKAVKTILDNEGRLDVLVNVAGVTLVGSFEKYSAKDYLRLLDINTVGAFRLIKFALPAMKRRKDGKIINITSLNGLVSLPGFSIYSSSKHALEALGLAASYELRKSGIYVTNIAPGAINFGQDGGKPLPHKPAREKFKFLHFLLPMVTGKDVAKKVLDIAGSYNPPNRVILGRDAMLLSLMQRFLPQYFWGKIMDYVWQKN